MIVKARFCSDRLPLYSKALASFPKRGDKSLEIIQRSISPFLRIGTFQKGFVLQSVCFDTIKEFSSCPE